jgi:hypothetical protein
MHHLYIQCARSPCTLPPHHVVVDVGCPPVKNSDQHLPVFATLIPDLKATHLVGYVFPSHPHTGEYSLVQADFVEVQVGPFEQDVVHAPRLLESARSIREVAAAGDAKVVAMMTAEVAVNSAKATFMIRVGMLQSRVHGYRGWTMNGCEPSRFAGYHI